MDIKTLAALLLAERLVSSLFIILVLRKQIRLFKLPLRVSADSLVRAIWARRILFFLAVAVLVGNLVPIAIDYLTVTADLSGRSTNPSSIGIAYAVSNATTSILYSLLVFALYKLAERITLLDHKD